MKHSQANFRNICQKLEDFRRQFEISRKNFKDIATELKPLLYQIPEIENKINENNRVIDSFLTSISNTIDSNVHKIQDVLNQKSFEELPQNFFFSNYKNEPDESKENSALFDSHSQNPPNFPLPKFIEYDKLHEHDQAYLSPEISALSNLNLPKDSQNFYKHPPEFPYDLNQSNQLYRFNGPNRIDSHSLQIQTNFPHLYNEDHEKSDFEINKKRKPNKRKNKEKIKKKSELISKRKSSDSESDSSGSISDSSIQSNASKAKLKRGKYHYYTLETKLKAIKLMEEGVDLKEVSKALAVPPKNLKRWYKVGPYRKKGGGRKTMDPNMENSLFEWCLKEIKDQKRLLTRSSIKQKARNLSQYPGTFKASKGWLDKFMKRYNYAEKAKQIFEEMKKDESKNSGKIESNELDFELPLKKEYTFHKDEIKYEEEEEIRNFDTIFLEEENKNNYD